MSDLAPPSTCSTCRSPVIRRVAGYWCPRCRRFLIKRLVPVYTAKGEAPLVLGWGLETKV